MPQITFPLTLKIHTPSFWIGLLALTFLLIPVLGLAAAPEENLRSAEETAGTVMSAVDYPDGALSNLSKAKQAVELAREVVQTSGDGELSIQAVEVIDQVAVSTASIVDQAPSPKDPGVMESALEVADISAEALLEAADTARNTGNTELALAVAEAAGHVDQIINTILGAAVEGANMGLVTAALAAEETMSRTVLELAGYAKAAGNPSLARQSLGIAERHPGPLENTYVFADATGSTTLAADITAVLMNYSQAILAVAQLAETSGNTALAQTAVDQAYAAATTLCRSKQLVQYSVSIGEDAQLVQAWESVLAQINTAETVTRNAIAAGINAGAAAPRRPPCFAGPPSWWREPPLNETRYAEDEEEAKDDDDKPVSPI